MSMPISAVIIAQNEERMIEECLKSLSFCDEIVVIDDFSTDQTVRIAERHKAKVYQHSLDDDYAKLRMYAFDHITHEWVLFVDADERVSPELQNEIQDFVKDPLYEGGLYIRRRDFFLGKEIKYGETAKVRNGGLLRLVKKGKGRWEGAVHERFTTDSPTHISTHFLDHYPHPTVKAFIEDVNVYSTLRAQELYKEHKKASIWQIVIYPSAKFILTYFVKQGYKDGPEGFIYAFMMSFHSFLARVKLWQMYLQK